MNKIVKRIFIIASGLVVICSVSAILMVYIMLPSAIEEIPFESNSWKNDTNRAHMKFPRQRMINSLLKANVLLGKTEKDILSMLGEPDSNYNENSDVKKYSYFIGPDRRFAGTDDEWLLVYFSPNNIVVQNELVVH